MGNSSLRAESKCAEEKGEVSQSALGTETWVMVCYTPLPGGQGGQGHIFSMYPAWDVSRPDTLA